MNTYDDYLTFALGKGRLSNKTMDLLEQIGITCERVPMFRLMLNTVQPISVW